MGPSFPNTCRIWVSHISCSHCSLILSSWIWIFRHHIPDINIFIIQKVIDNLQTLFLITRLLILSCLHTSCNAQARHSSPLLRLEFNCLLLKVNFTIIWLNLSCLSFLNLLIHHCKLLTLLLMIILW